MKIIKIFLLSIVGLSGCSTKWSSDLYGIGVYEKIDPVPTVIPL